MLHLCLKAYMGHAQRHEALAHLLLNSLGGLLTLSRKRVGQLLARGLLLFDFDAQFGQGLIAVLYGRELYTKLLLHGQ